VITSSTANSQAQFWTLFTVAGTTRRSGHAADVSGGAARMLESARGIRPDDNGDAANAARRTEAGADFDGLPLSAGSGSSRRRASMREKYPA